MKIALGADHRGFALKESLKAKLTAMGHEVLDKGSASTDSSDYPDYAIAVGEALEAGDVERGVLVCGSGIGVCIAANKVRGVRAAPVHSVQEATLSRNHNDSNVLCLSASVTDEGTAEDIVSHWLQTDFEGGRHARRISKIEDYEKKHSC